MTTRRLRHLLSLATMGLALAAAGAVAWAFVVPVAQDDNQIAELEAAGGQASGNRPETELPERSSLIALSEKPLRQQLFDPPPPEPEQPPPPPPLPVVELMITSLPSQGEPSAWVRDAENGNAPKKVGIGDTLGPTDNSATITAIEPSRLLVEHNGEIKPIDRAATSPGGRR